MASVTQPVFVPAPELPLGPRNALVIATSRYDDEELRHLRSPVRDAEDLAAVLAHPSIGGFSVTSLIDKTELQIRQEIESFLSGRGPDETILIYLSCHGIQDDRGRLYFAATDTKKKQPRVSAVRAADLLEQLDDCRARRQILILDCCFSGSFGESKGDLNLEHQLSAHTRGREVLTASRGSEYSYEGELIDGAITGSVFTTGLVEGLRTGRADRDRDGRITVEEAYQHAFLHVRETQTGQTPQHWLSGGEGGQIVLARSALGREINAADLPEHVLVGLENPAPIVRIGGSPLAELRMLSARDIAGILSVPEVTVRTKWRDWGLPAYRIGRHLRWRERDVLAWIDGQAIDPRPPSPQESRSRRQ